MEGRVTYHIDRLDVLTDVGHAWAEFATSNGAPKLAAGVVGRSMWEFVVDETTRQVYRDLLVRVRLGRAVRFEYRCDAPAARRFMQMTMAPRGQFGVSFDSLTLKTEARPEVPVGSGAAPGDGLLRVCSWCKRVDVAGEWDELEVAVSRLALFATSRAPTITHAMCPECLATMMKEIDGA